MAPADSPSTSFVGSAGGDRSSTVGSQPVRSRWRYDASASNETVEKGVAESTGESLTLGHADRPSSGLADEGMRCHASVRRTVLRLVPGFSRFLLTPAAGNGNIAWRWSRVFPPSQWTASHHIDAAGFSAALRARGYFQRLWRGVGGGLLVPNAIKAYLGLTCRRRASKLRNLIPTATGTWNWPDTLAANNAFVLSSGGDYGCSGALTGRRST